MAEAVAESSKAKLYRSIKGVEARRPAAVVLDKEMERALQYSVIGEKA